MSKKIRRVFNWTLIFTFSFVIVFIILKQNHEKIDEEKVNWEARNAIRINNIKRVCEKYNLGIYKNHKDDGKNIIKYPPTPQYTASTTWLYNICLLMRIPEAELSSGREQISTIARRVIPELDYPEAEEAMQDTTKLLVVRHPFERLLSAYRDKLENSIAGRQHGTLHFYRKYGSAIVKKYRGNDFVKPRDDQVIHPINLPKPAGIEPTWSEFVDYIIDTELESYGDDHWMPYYLFCTPCSLNYSLVAKVETLYQDQLFAFEKLGLSQLIKPHWKHKVGISNAARIYFKQLNISQVNRLYNKYKLDFEMFAYSVDEYFQFTHDYATEENPFEVDFFSDVYDNE
ncbi:hypothetical protein HCN44_011131 [Aphidius gifuensis]|uniref:Carbohydrate sulfotransferase n=1 Tax=Aphidius gifuensis TaxID=684658 RepID=A0A834XY95_APHGI|nr:hypothetical protein HCN44_011131 [Aphidius gifuensis]